MVTLGKAGYERDIETGDRRDSARQGSDHVENENLIRTAFEGYANGNVAAVTSSITASGARQSAA